MKLSGRPDPGRRAADAAMKHRHIEPRGYSLAAIDDIIARGKMRDWVALREALRRDPSLGSKIIRVCQAHIHDPYAQRYHFWNNYVRMSRDEQPAE